MKLLCASILMTTLILSALSPRFAAAAASSADPDPSSERPYAKGCIIEAAADIVELKAPITSRDDPRLRSRISDTSALSSGALGFLFSVSKPSLPKLVDLKSLMSPVKDQTTDLGSCTAFAIVACLEFLEPGREFSETELYLRVKTNGKSSRKYEGCDLRLYIPLLLEGVIESRFFMDYTMYIEYLIKRKLALSSDRSFRYHDKWRSPLKRLPVRGDGSYLSSDPDYKETIMEFKDWCLKNYESEHMPEVVKPCWPIEREYNHAEWEKDVPREHAFVDRDAYYGRFDCTLLNPKNIELLKTILAAGIPLVVGVTTFAEKTKYLDKDGNEQAKMITDYWGKNYLRPREWVVDLPPVEMPNGGHAICLCGYDDAIAAGIGAFRFKNSWGTDWGEKGYAWITYRYVELHAFYVLKINKL